MLNAERISRREFYHRGGLAHPRLYRKANSRGAWSYYMLHH